MVSKKGGLVITGLGVLSLLFSIIYASSCTKPIEDNPWACNYVYCQNGGRCDSAKCKCPTGYEGSDCGIATVDKYLGNWKMNVKYTGSDSADLVGTDTNYISDWKPSASATVFFLNRFDNNPYYNNIVCLLDSLDRNHFILDTTSALNMMYDHFRIRGGSGDINKTKDTVNATIYIRRLNATINWQNDTLRLVAVKI